MLASFGRFVYICRTGRLCCGVLLACFTAIINGFMSEQGFLRPLRVFLRSVPNNRLMVVLSIVTGLAGGLAAVLLKNAVHYTSLFLTGDIERSLVNLLFLAYPFVGILLTVVFVKGFIREDIVHGITRILYAISRKNSKLKKHNTYASIVASTLTVGFGGSVGLESPIVLTGSAIGSNLGQWFRLNYRSQTLLLGCGAAAAIAGIFKAPIAGVVFVLEIFMLDLTVSSMGYLLIASVTSATVSTLLLGKGVVFDFTMIDPFSLNNIPFYLILGIVCAFVSAAFTWGIIAIEGRFGRIRQGWKKLAIGGLGLGLLIFLFPSLYGEGYEAMQMILSGNSPEIAHNSFFYQFRDNGPMLLLFLTLVLAAKVVACGITTGAGGVGGTFAPTLFMGGLTGFIIGHALNLAGFTSVSEKNFALVGMGGLMAGVMHAPLTAIFLIAEITGGYSLFLPLILTSTIAFMVSRYIRPHSIYTHRLAKRGDLLTHDKDKSVLVLMKPELLIERDFATIGYEANLRALTQVISRSKRNLFPVVDEENHMRGVVLLDDVREMIFNPELYDTVWVKELITPIPVFIEMGESAEEIMSKFESTGAWNLPVLEKGRYMGFLSKSKMLTAYREQLVQFSE